MLVFMQCLKFFQHLPWILFPWETFPKSSCFGILRSSIFMTCPVQWSCILRIMACMLVVTALLRIFKFMTVPPSDFQDWSEAAPVEAFLKCPCLTSIQEAGENNSLVHFELCWLPDDMLIQYSSTQASKGLVGFTNPGTDLFVKQAITGDNASKVLELFTLSSVFNLQ